MSEYGDLVKRLPSANEEIRRTPCLWCKSLTLVETLNQYGARCFNCYEAYCREPQPAPSVMADKRHGDPKAWAEALKQREEAGERLTLAQRDMWRAALGKNKFAGPDAEESTP